MKKNVIELIKILGIGLYEIIVDIEIDGTIFNSIEWDREEDKILLHLFNGENYDYSYDFEDFDADNQLKIYNRLSIIYN